MNLQMLIQARSAKQKELQELLNVGVKEQRDFTDDEEEKYTTLEKEFDTLDKQIKRIQSNDARGLELDTLSKPPLVGTQYPPQDKPKETPQRGYSLLRAVNAMITNDWSNAELET